MAKKKQEKKKGGVGIFAILLAMVAAILYFLSDCLGGLGLGGGLGSGTGDAEAEASASAAASSEPPPVASQDAPTPFKVAVEGTKCKLGDGELDDCDTICEQIRKMEPKPSSVEIDADQGSHGTVESIRTCLESEKLDVQIP